MAINHDYAGRRFEASEPHEVSRVKIAEFAHAIGDQNPIYRDQAAAQAAGFRDVVAPPTFAIVISMVGSSVALADPALGLNLALVVHSEQRFTCARPLQAGDMVTAQTTISDIRDVGRTTLLSTETEIRTTEGELVCTAYSTIAERGGGA